MLFLLNNPQGVPQSLKKENDTMVKDAWFKKKFIHAEHVHSITSLRKKDPCALLITAHDVRPTNRCCNVAQARARSQFGCSR